MDGQTILAFLLALLGLALGTGIIRITSPVLGGNAIARNMEQAFPFEMGSNGAADAWAVTAPAGTPLRVIRSDGDMVEVEVKLHGLWVRGVTDARILSEHAQTTTR
jgi:hypothetical protein